MIYLKIGAILAVLGLVFGAGFTLAKRLDLGVIAAEKLAGDRAVAEQKAIATDLQRRLDTEQATSASRAEAFSRCEDASAVIIRARENEARLRAADTVRAAAELEAARQVIAEAQSRPFSDDCQTAVRELAGKLLQMEGGGL